MTSVSIVVIGIPQVLFKLADNDRGYGHGRFAGVFAVAQRQGECGRKTR